ncbi:hypothetical protein [Thermosipho globiformans]|uniref:hypothetical protein n=1 Tax=Thermosipho globiformans TaxID=380685 RepID=UPI000F8CCFB7|nr:hypothetical protein [Thermosipho globiformans]
MSDAQVQLFIEVFKDLCKKGCVTFAPRQKNKEFLAKIGWTVEDVLEYLYEKLSHEYLHSGPEEEKDQNYESGIIYIFLMPIENFSVYVKIKKFEGIDNAIVISFHEEGRW